MVMMMMMMMMMMIDNDGGLAVAEHFHAHNAGLASCYFPRLQKKNSGF